MKLITNNYLILANLGLQLDAELNGCGYMYEINGEERSLLNRPIPRINPIKMDVIFIKSTRIVMTFNRMH